MRRPLRVLAACLILLGTAACADETPEAQPAGQTSATPPKGTTPGPTQQAGQGNGWCEAWTELNKALTAWNKVAYSQAGSSVAEVEASARTVRTRLDQMLAAAPAAHRADAKAFYDYNVYTVESTVKTRRGEKTKPPPPGVLKKYSATLDRLAANVGTECR